MRKKFIKFDNTYDFHEWYKKKYECTGDIWDTKRAEDLVHSLIFRDRDIREGWKAANASIDSRLKHYSQVESCSGKVNELIRAKAILQEIHPVYCSMIQRLLNEGEKEQKRVHPPDMLVMAIYKSILREKVIKCT